MIKGMGVDIVGINRIEKLVEKYDNHFIHKVYTGEEIAYCKRMARPGIHFAGRWAAKEAFYKALPVSCQSHSSWKSMEIAVCDRGKPFIRVCSDFLRDLLCNEGIVRYHVSISHEKTYCCACVLFEGD